ncbi:MAG: nitronate monooxygenase [Deltaproteobacteria bacterium]|nr:MAG: nitronate monooxygenase [Deltaproteobacteria bacterium]
MHTKLAKEMGLEAPIFAFTRSKEVVLEVSRKGGLGVLGAVAMTPEELDEACTWLDERLDGKPYGVDTVMPMAYEGKGEEWTEEKLRALISPAHHQFVAHLLEKYGVGELPADYERKGEDLLGWSDERGRAHVEVALRHPIALIANALGTPPADCIELAKEHGVKIAALCGKKKQALRHKEAGLDIIIAQGTEAGGHTGEVAGMVLTPEIVDAVGDTPVLTAGGIGSGRQMAAALALGAQGVWTGSIWLTTREHLDYHAPIVVEKLLEAQSTDTVRSRAISGKPARQLKTAWTEAWESKESPGYLPIPLMWMVQAEAVERIYHHSNKPLAGSPVGQIVGSMNEIKPTAEVMDALITECQATLERLCRLGGLA